MFASTEGLRRTEQIVVQCEIREHARGSHGSSQDGGVGVASPIMLGERPAPGASLPCRPTSAHPARPPLRVDKEGLMPLRRGAGGAGRRAPLERRHPRRAGGGGAQGQGTSRSTRAPRDHWTARQDAPSQGAWRAARHPPQPRASGRDVRPCDRAIDLLVVNLYPFEATVAKGASTRIASRTRHRRPAMIAPPPRTMAMSRSSSRPRTTPPSSPTSMRMTVR